MAVVVSGRNGFSIIIIYLLIGFFSLSQPVMLRIHLLRWSKQPAAGKQQQQQQSRGAGRRKKERKRVGETLTSPPSSPVARMERRQPIKSIRQSNQSVASVHAALPQRQAGRVLAHRIHPRAHHEADDHAGRACTKRATLSSAATRQQWQQQRRRQQQQQQQRQ